MSTEYRKREYPIQGKTGERYETTGFIKVDSFRVDAGILGQNITHQVKTFKKGDLILGFRVRVTEAVTSGNASTTVQFGFTGVRMLSAAIAKTSLDAVGDLAGPDLTNGSENGPYLLTADDTFDIINSNHAALTAGKFDIDVVYLPADNRDLGSDYHEFVSAAS